MGVLFFASHPELSHHAHRAFLLRPLRDCAPNLVRIAARFSGVRLLLALRPGPETGERAWESCELPTRFSTGGAGTFGEVSVHRLRIETSHRCPTRGARGALPPLWRADPDPPLVERAGLAALFGSQRKSADAGRAIAGAHGGPHFERRGDRLPARGGT